MPLVLEIVLPLALLAVILTVMVSWLVGRARQRRRELLARLEAEGIEKTSGTLGGTARYLGFSMPGLYVGAGARTVSMELVLTQQTLAILGGVPMLPPIPRTELARYAVTRDGDAIVIATDRPVGAEGQITLRLRTPDAESWVRALRDAGASGG